MANNGMVQEKAVTTLSEEQRQQGIDALLKTRYALGGSLDRDRKNNDVELAVRNIANLDMDNVVMIQFFEQLNVAGVLVAGNPNNWDVAGKALRNELLTDIVSAYFARE